MKKLVLIAAIFAIAFTACGNKSGNKNSADTIVGSWVMPVEGQPGVMQGIKLEEGGDASSINMATLEYKYWDLNGDDLYLTVKSIGNGLEVEGVDTLKIEKLTADSLVLHSNYGYTLRYARQK